jgi:heat shock protein HslJ
MRLNDLDDVSPVEPDDELLARVHTRSRSFRHRRSTQRVTSAVSGVLVIALAVGLALTRVDSGNRHVTAPGPAATSTTAAPTTTTTPAPRPVTAADLVGWWRVLSIAGYHGPLTTPPLGEASRLQFGRGTSWNGSDGCNYVSGTYQVTSGGHIHFATGLQTLVRCRYETPTPSSLTIAARAEIADRVLTFFDHEGHALATYQHVTATARLELPARTMGAGSSLAGQVVVDNDTGAPLNASGCLSYFAALLVKPGSAQEPGQLTCLQEFTFPVGESTYPISVSASENSCGGVPLGANQPCLPTGGTPPLAPGEYQAKLFPTDGIFQTPPPLIVHVTNVCSNAPLDASVPRLPTSAGISSIPGLTKVRSGAGSLAAFRGPASLVNYGCYSPVASLSQTWLLNAAIAKYGSADKVPPPIPASIAAQHPGAARVDLEVIAFKDSEPPRQLLTDPEFATKHGWSEQPDEHIPNGVVLRVDNVGPGIREWLVLRAAGNEWIETGVYGANVTVTQAEHIAESVGP